VRRDARETRGLTLVEVLVVIATLGVLAAMLCSALGSAAARGRRTICLANVRQINQDVSMYAADNHDLLFPLRARPDRFREVINDQEWTSYVPLIGRYVGWTEKSAPQDKLFACPADSFFLGADSRHQSYWASESHHSQSNMNYSSYLFNAANAVFQGPVRAKFPNLFPGVLGWRLNSIRAPTRTLLLGETPAWDAYSWHSPSQPRRAYVNNALDMLGFADGHGSYVKIYFDDLHYPPGLPRAVFAFDPPPGYEYQWSGN